MIHEKCVIKGLIAQSNDWIRYAVLHNNFSYAFIDTLIKRRKELKKTLYNRR